MPFLLNQQLQAWHEGLEMIFNIVVRFNILFYFLIKKGKHPPSIEHALECYIYIYIWNTAMQLNNVTRFEKWIDGGIVKTSKIETFGHRWKYKRKLLSHINVHKIISTFNVVNVETVNRTSVNIPIVFIASFSSLSLTCSMHSSASTSTNGMMRRS